MYARDSGWEKDLRRANRGKEGAPFLYADGLMMMMMMMAPPLP